jgi:hypothetical protein
VASQGAGTAAAVLITSRRSPPPQGTQREPSTPRRHELSVVAELEASEGEDLVALLTALGVLALLVMTVAVASELTSASSEQKRRAESAGPAARR